MAVEYERERERKIAKNRQRMRELGVGVATSGRKNSLKPSKALSNSTVKQKTKATQPPRRTGRARTAVRSYSDEEMLSVERVVGVAPSRGMVPYSPEPCPDTWRKSALQFPECRGDVSRHPDGYLVFKDRPDFKPNLTPAQVIAAGSWGGCYFHPRGGKPGVRGPCAISTNEFPSMWYDNLEPSMYSSRRYNCDTNFYKVKAGQDQAYWEEHGWIDERDPRGFQWYCRFFCGRRLDDGEDDRQISRWKGVCGDKGRWKRNLINKIINANASWDDCRVSPVVRQTLLHWASEVTENEVITASKNR